MFFPGGLSARSMDMFAFAIALERAMRRPVIDKTRLEGRFDLDVTFAPELDGPPVAAAASLPALPTALREQLGLRLESGREPVSVLVVDHVQAPSDN